MGRVSASNPHGLGWVKDGIDGCEHLNGPWENKGTYFSSRQYGSVVPSQEIEFGWKYHHDLSGESGDLRYKKAAKARVFELAVAELDTASKPSMRTSSATTGSSRRTIYEQI